MQGLSILIANIVMSGRSGTEIMTRIMAEGLLKLGHRPVVYTSSIGPLAHELRAMSIPVVDDITQINLVPDIIHGNHNPTLAAAIARFPDTPAVFACHDFVAWHSAPPELPQICQYIAVSEASADRLVAEHGVSPDNVEILLNCVDTSRFASGRTLPDKPVRVLAYSNYSAHRGALSEACSSRNLDLDFVGLGSGKFSEHPEELLPDYEIVITSGLGAMEAMSCGAAVILCDGRGLAAMITEDRLATFRRANFGLRVLRRPVSSVLIGEEIDCYNPGTAMRVSERLRAEASVDTYLESLCRLYRRVIEKKTSPFPQAQTKVNIALARHLQQWAPHEPPANLIMRERLRLLEATLQIRSGICEIDVGRTHRFGDSSVAFWHGLYGFCATESWGMWSEGSDATMLLVLTPRAAGGIALLWQMRGFTHEDHPAFECKVFVNGRSFATWHFSHLDQTRGSITQKLYVPADVGRLLYIRFEIHKPVSPRQLGISDDARRLGVGFEAVTVSST